MRLKSRFLLAAAALMASAAAFAQTPPPAPTITPITIAAPALPQVFTKTMNGRTMTAYAGPGVINPDAVAPATPSPAMITVTVEKTVDASGNGVINGGINVLNKATGQMIAGRLIGLVKGGKVAIMVEGAMRNRMTTMMDRSLPLMLRGVVSAEEITIDGTSKPALKLGVDGVTMTMPTMTMMG